MNISGRWVAVDVAKQNRNAPLQLLSVHDRVINLKEEGQFRLLMLAHPLLPRGPACVGLTADLFNRCRDLLSRGVPVYRAPGTLHLGGEHGLSVSWRGWPEISFDPPERLAQNTAGITKALHYYAQWLEAVEAPSAAAVLLGVRGPDPYFRAKIGQHFPEMVGALLDCNEPEFRRQCSSLVGLGRGSTPTGDDLVFGALVAVHYYNRMAGTHAYVPALPVEAAGQTTPLGAHMLELGQSGLAPQPVRQFVLSIFHGQPQKDLLLDLLDMGSSSGYEIAAALLYTLKLLVRGPGGRSYWPPPIDQRREKQSLPTLQPPLYCW